MEGGRIKHTPLGTRSVSLWPVFRVAVTVFGLGLQLIGLYRRGVENALAVRLTRLELGFPTLPPAFHGYRVLHLTDLHVDHLEGTTEAAIRLVSGLDVDLCVLTGDYRRATGGPFEQVLPGMQRLVEAVGAHDGAFATLGNHDPAAIVTPLEDLGVRVLVNESIHLERGDDRICLTGLDDVHFFYTESASEALRTSGRGFKIALVHSAEVADLAAAAGFDLYLCGHTHAGQICLPGGAPILTRAHRLRQYSAGLWRHDAMTGYTSSGTGVSALPVRFNCPAEVVLITLEGVASPPRGRNGNRQRG